MRVACFWAYFVFVTAANFLGLYVRSTFKLVYKSVNLVQWKTADNMNPEALWVEVYNYRDASGERVYADLALFALSLLSLPLSNADDERVFSQVNIIKSKTRNRIVQRFLECCTFFMG